MKNISCNLPFSLLLILSLFSVSCENQDPCEDGTPCNRETVKEIKNTIGEVRYDNVREEFHNIFTPQGTYDSQYITISCSSLGEEFKQEGTKVKRELDSFGKSLCPSN